MNIRLHFFLFMLPLTLLGQSGNNLHKRSFDYLDGKIDEYKGKKAVFKFLDAYLKKAKDEDNDEEIINAYQNYIYEVDDNLKIIYNDSMVYTAERTDSNELMGSAVLTRGIIYYNRKEYGKALDCYVIANRLIATTGNTYLKKKVQYNIAHIKYYLGYYNEAISLFKSCADYFKEEDERAYLSCLHSLVLSYTKLGAYVDSEQTSRLALKESKKLKNNSMLPYISHAQGVNDYFRKLYQPAVNKLKNSLAILSEKKDFANISVAYYYLGACYWETGEKDTAVDYFLKVDKIFVDRKYTRPDLRRGYELLIDYYAGKKDRDKELLYINRLLQVDKILHANFRYLSGKIFKEYDTAELQRAKSNIESELKQEKLIRAIVMIIISMMVPAFLYLLHRNRKLRLYKKSFEAYKENFTIPVTEKISIMKKPVISENLERHLLERLENFEKTNGFTKQDMKTDKLAAQFGTNSKYLSQVVNYHKGKSYPEYINDLRIAYIIKRLEEDVKLRKFNYSEIAREAGYGTAQQFTDVFKRKMGMPLSYFLDELTKT